VLKVVYWLTPSFVYPFVSSFVREFILTTVLSSFLPKSMDGDLGGLGDGPLKQLRWGEGRPMQPSPQYLEK